MHDFLFLTFYLNLQKARPMSNIPLAHFDSAPWLRSRGYSNINNNNIMIKIEMWNVTIVLASLLDIIVERQWIDYNARLRVFNCWACFLIIRQIYSGCIVWCIEFRWTISVRLYHAIFSSCVSRIWWFYQCSRGLQFLFIKWFKYLTNRFLCFHDYTVSDEFIAFENIYVTKNIILWKLWCRYVLYSILVIFYGTSIGIWIFQYLSPKLYRNVWISNFYHNKTNNF